MYITKYQLYPNNEIRAIMYRAVPRTRFLARPVLLWVEFYILTAIAPSETAQAFPTDRPLDISSKVDQRSEEMPHRRTTFGLPAKRTLLRLGGAYDTVDNDPSHYIFLTGTIPGGTHDAFMAVAKQSAYITHSIAKWLKRTCPSQYWFYVWELQKRGALHIHYCIYAPDSRISDKILREWRDKWEGILETVGTKTGADMWLRKDGTYHTKGHDVLQAYAQKVRKSVAAYLAGYCGGSKDKHSSDSTSPYYPGRWWGCSRESTKLLKGLTQEVSIEHTNYRDAHRNLRTHYERVLHDSPKAHYYPHRVGVGASVVSYHPQDKGTEEWQRLAKMIHKPQSFPNASSWIASLVPYIQTWLSYYNGLKKPKGKHSPRLVQDLEDILSQDSLSRYTLHQRDLRIILRTTSELSLNTIAQSAGVQTMNVLVPPIWMYHQIQPLLKWNQHGWLSLPSDVPVGLTDCWVYDTLGTKLVETTGDCSIRGETEPSSLPFLTQLEFPL